MKKCLAAALAAIALALALPLGAFAADPQSNINAQNYNTWDAAPVSSYLFKNGQGGVTRVERTGSVALVEEYGADLLVKKSLEIPMELPLWGGFFAGSRYNFFIFGQSNPVERDNVEVIRVVKYSKSWERLGQASLKGVNTSVPFFCGSLRMAEAGGMLYLRTSHQMYADRAGNRSQANMTVAVRQSDMSVTDSAHQVENVGCGYMSDSFNQFLLTDSDRRLVALDQCDDFPSRGAVISIFARSAGSANVTGGDVTSVMVQPFPTVKGGDRRITGASLGGFGETGTKYVAAYSFDGAGVSGKSADKAVYLAVVDKQTLEVETACLSDPGVSTPQLVLTDEGGFVLWNETDRAGNLTDTLCYVPFDGEGIPGETRKARAPLSDCAPLYVDGQVMWYVSDGDAVTFYILSEEGVSSRRVGAPFADVKEDDEMYDAVLWSVKRGYILMETEDSFGRNTPARRAEVVMGIWRGMGSPEPEKLETDFTDISPEDPYYKAVIWAAEAGVTNGTTPTTFDPEGTLKRQDTVTFLFRAAGAETPAGRQNPFSDVRSGEYYTGAILWAVDRGIAKGTSDTLFSPLRSVTKCELAAFLYRWKNS